MTSDTETLSANAVFFLVLLLLLVKLIISPDNNRPYWGQIKASAAHLADSKFSVFVEQPYTIKALNTKRSFKRQGHATFEALCWLFCAMVESRNNGRLT